MSSGDQLSGLSEAQHYADGTVVFAADDGGQIYLVARANCVRVSEDTLQEILRDIDAIEWPGNPSDASAVEYDRYAVGDGIVGGMGGGEVTDGIWIHPNLVAQGLDAPILQVLTGQRMRIGESRMHRGSGVLSIDDRQIAVGTRLWSLREDGGQTTWGGELSLNNRQWRAELALYGESSRVSALLDLHTHYEAQCIAIFLSDFSSTAFVQGIGPAPF
jgi:hypothetical protein